jgi:hypothetical protein
LAASSFSWSAVSGAYWAGWRYVQPLNWRSQPLSHTDAIYLPSAAK